MVRIQGRGVAGTVAAKVKHLFGLCKEFEEKVRKWRLFLTDVGCFEMQNAASYVVHEDQWTDRFLILVCLVNFQSSGKGSNL